MNFLISKNFYKYSLISAIFIFSFFSFCEAVNAANVYYSVGQNATDHKTGSPTITISSGMATFSVAQTATNMGVGDRVTYDTSKVAYISGKVSQTQWNLVTATGAMPTNEASPVTVNSIAHEYTSLSAAEAGASDSNHLNTTDLTSGGGYVLNFPCYYDSGADTASVTVDGWTTGASNYIKIYTPNDTSTEVNQSQRHNGKWNDSRYKIENPNVYAPINISAVKDVIIDGIQFSTGKTTSTVESIICNNASTVFNVIIKNIIFRGHPSATYKPGGVRVYSGASGSVLKVYNSIFYNMARGIYQYNSNTTTYSYNNTVYGNTTGFTQVNTGVLVAKNNISYNNTDNYAGTFDASSTNNLSGPSQTDAPGSNPRNATAVSFVNTGSGTEDFHLQSTDTGAKDYGISDPGSGLFSDDIDGEARSGSWDIGVDEVVISVAPSVQFKRNINFKRNIRIK